ncbi:hypothetical protein FRC10_001723 [Ceratobasidium sp. 414]|nr:hypothetical protein FRC10_001723 [Ceratobasidium sp. 414]
MTRNNYHDRMIDSLRNERETGYLPPFRCDLSMHLVAHLSIMMEDIVKRGKLERNSLMKTFEEVFLPGMTFGIHARWKHAAFLDESGALTMMDQLRELVIRYSMVSTGFEDLILHRHYLELYGTVDHPTKLGPVDRDDLVKVVACCVLKLNPPEGCPGAAPKLIPLDFATDLMDTLFYDINETKAFELCLPLLKAGFIRLWLDLPKVPEDNTIRWIDAAPFTFQLLQMSQYVNLLSDNHLSLN